jgi:SPX domain protein involved in polyphosphate accumulation
MVSTRSLVPLALTTILSLAAFAGDAGKKVKLQGHLVDVQCSITEKEEPAYMRSKHSRSCFQMPGCEQSGYALLTPDDKIIRFDATGNEKAKKLIAAAKNDKDWRIKVQGRLNGDILAVSKLEAQR